MTRRRASGQLATRSKLPPHGKVGGEIGGVVASKQRGELGGEVMGDVTLRYPTPNEVTTRRARKALDVGGGTDGQQQQ